MTSRLSLLCLIMPVLGAPVAMASAPAQCSGTAHTTHVIAANKDATCVLSKLYEPQVFCISDAKGNDISGQPFDVASGQNVTFGMIVTSDDADFNMEYALTCVVKDGAISKSPKVIFAIGADGPATPNITVTALNGAAGSWASTGVGENYSLTF